MICRILPSLLAADPGHLADDAKRAEVAGADEMHLDIMDGHFVPNISFGPDVVAMAHRVLTIPLNVHLMLSRPDLYIERFAKAGAHTIQIHVESECDIAATLRAIRELGVHPAIVINPETDGEVLDPYLSLVDEVLCMTVHPGYGGQSFMAEVLPKVRSLREKLLSLGKSEDFPLMVDGGVSLSTIKDCALSGANSFVAGSALFRASDMAADIKMMRSLAKGPEIR